MAALCAVVGDSLAFLHGLSGCFGLYGFVGLIENFDVVLSIRFLGLAEILLLALSLQLVVTGSDTPCNLINYGPANIVL